MNVNAAELRAIASKRKTMHRVLVGTPRVVKRPGPRGLERTGQSASRIVWPFSPFKGEVLAVTSLPDPNGREIPDPIRATVIDVRREPAGAITDADAKREGNINARWWMQAWVRKHDRAWLKRELVDRADIFGDDAVAFILCKRFEERWADREVWVMTLEPLPEVPRFMARVGGYVTAASMSIEPTAECVDDLYQRRLSEKARKDNEARRASFKRDLEVERAKRNGVNTNLHTKTLARVNGFHDRQAKRAA